MVIFAPGGTSTALAFLAAGAGILWPSCLPCLCVWSLGAPPRPPLALLDFLLVPWPPVVCSPASAERGDGRCEVSEFVKSSDSLGSVGLA
eukprot:11169710-Lingulodinium_polyedra.AAC.1